MWFAIFPTVDTLAGQALAALIGIGSFFFAKKQRGGKGIAPVELAATAEL